MLRCLLRLLYESVKQNLPGSPRREVGLASLNAYGEADFRPYTKMVFSNLWSFFPSRIGNR